MNLSEFTSLLKKPQNIDALKTQQLEAIVNEFPYFQSARAIQLKGLNQTNSYKYNAALKKTATYTINRNVLFNFITTPLFFNKKTQSAKLLNDIDVFDTEAIQSLHKKISHTQPLENTTQKQALETSEKAQEILQIGTPIPFNSQEAHSFNEWMQLTAQKPIVRTSVKKDLATKTLPTKTNLIDTFIETNPKISPLDKNTVNTSAQPKDSHDHKSFMTETLAKVYLEQHKYENAIKAYRILSLKYPEKSGFFADQIKAIKILQKNKI